MNTPVAIAAPDRRPRYLEPIVPVVFPEGQLMPETKLHLDLRTLLYQLLSDYLGQRATVGSDQFIYYAADDPRACVAPDAYVKLGVTDDDVRSWKTWERGAPEVAVEILSDEDRGESAWKEKLSRYARLGVAEVVRFDSEAAPEAQLRVWDRVEERLVEREVKEGRAPSLVLNLSWVVAPTQARAVTLRIAEDQAGQRLVPTQTEARLLESHARELAEERARVAEQRLRELEAELKNR
jgi:Uma2 family endonuclease